MFRADERRGYPALDRAIATGVKPQKGPDVFARELPDIGLDCLGRPDAAGDDRTVEADDKVIAEIARHRPTVMPGHADHAVFRRQDFHGGILFTGEKIEDDIILTRLLEGEPEPRRPVRRSQLNGGLPGVEPDFVVARLGNLVGVVKGRNAVRFAHHELAAHGHQGEGAVLGNPGAGLMGLADAAEFMVLVLIVERVPLRLGVGRPGVHGKGQRDGGIGIAVGKGAGGIGALQRVGEMHQVEAGGARGEREGQTQANRLKGAHDDSITVPPECAGRRQAHPRVHAARDTVPDCPPGGKAIA